MIEPAIRCTVEERILIHLIDYSKYLETWESPFDITQEGIAAAVGVIRPAATRELSKMRRKGLIIERSCHITNEKRKRKAYFLSSSGLGVGREIRENLMARTVRLMTPGEDVAHITLLEAPGRLKVDLTPVELIRSVTPSGTFDRTKAIELDAEKRCGNSKAVAKKQTRLSSIAFSDNIPVNKNFIGRTEELMTLSLLLRSKQTRIIVVHGIAGMGKTTLVSRLLELSAKDRSVFWYSFGRWNSFRNVMIPLSDFLLGLGRTELGEYLRTGKDFEFGHFLHLVSKEGSGLGALLVFDNFQMADDKTIRFFSTLLPVLERIDETKIIIVSRDVPTFYNRRDIKVKKSVAEVKLEGLDLPSARMMLGTTKLDEDQVRRIFKVTQGHPLALELLDPAQGMDDMRDIEMFIEEEILRDLSAPEKALLGMASVYRYPVDANAYFHLGTDPELAKDQIGFGSEPTQVYVHGLEPPVLEVDHEILSRLVKRSLIKEEHRLYTVHDLVREFFYARLKPQQVGCYHKAAASHYSTVTGDQALVEMIYHLLRAKDRTAPDLVIEYGPGLVYKGYMEFMNILEEFKKDMVDPKRWEEISRLKKDAVSRMGALRYRRKKGSRGVRQGQ